METGFYDLYSIHPKHEGTYRPPYLHFNDDVRAYQDNTNDSIIGEITYAKGRFKGDDEFDERSSLTFNCDDPVASITFIVFDEPVVYTNSTPIWCNTEAFRARKVCQMLVKPSVFTGKLRLFVQALYGSARDDYYTFEEIPFIEKPLYVGDIELQYNYIYGSAGSGTHGIYTNEYLDYYLIHIKPSTISVRRMTPKGDGKWILQNLRRQVEKGSISDEDREKVEAYLLSTCEIDLHEEIFKGFEPLDGLPIHFGWHFNWQGSQADIVLITRKPQETDLLYATHYRFTISEPVRGSLSFELSSNFKEMPWYGVGNKVVWTPDLLVRQMIAEVNPLKEGSAGWDIADPQEWGAYIYCYYDIDDRFTLVGLSNVYDPGGFVPGEYFVGCGEISGRRLYQTVDYTAPYSHLSKVGVYTEGESAIFEYEFDTKSDYNGQQVEYFVGRGLGNYTSPYPIGDGGTGNLRKLPLTDNNYRICNGLTFGQHAIELGILTDEPHAGSISGYTININGQEKNLYITYNVQPNYPVDFHRTYAREHKGVVHTIAVPYDDAEMVFLGEQVHSFWSGSETDIQVYKNGYVHAYVIYNTWYVDDVGEKVLVQTYGPFSCRATRIYNQDTGGFPFIFGDEDTVRIGTPKDGDIVNVEADDWYQYSRYFDCDWLSNPVGYFYAEHRQSVRGASNPVYQDLFDVDNGYIYHTAVGWA